MGMDQRLLLNRVRRKAGKMKGSPPGPLGSANPRIHQVLSDTKAGAIGLSQGRKRLLTGERQPWLPLPRATQSFPKTL